MASDSAGSVTQGTKSVDDKSSVNQLRRKIAVLPQRHMPKRFPVDRSGIRWLARSLDLVLGLALAFYAAAAYGLDLWNADLRSALPYIAAPIAAFFGMRMSGAYWFIYDERVTAHMARTIWGAACGLGSIVILSLAFGLGTPISLLFHVCAILLLSFAAFHAHYIAFVKALTRAGELSDNVVIIGATKAAENIIRKNSEIQEMNILGVFDDRLGRAPNNIQTVPVIGTVDDLMTWDRLTNVDRIIITVTSTAQERVRKVIDTLRTLPQEIILVLDLDGFAPESTSVASIVNDAPAAYISGAPRDARRAALKRVLDIVVGSLMLVAFAPLMLVIAVLIKLDSEGPVFFRQKRHGFNNQHIRVWKFRSMRPDKAAEEGKIKQTLADDDRITKIGSFIRKTSFDELPQLFNIIRGEMSLVGPRPHPVSMTAEAVEVHNIIAEYAHRHRMKPGLTGWAQINGSRGPVHTTEEVTERVRLDMEYMRRSNLWLDMYIILMTAPCLLGDRDKIR